MMYNNPWELYDSYVNLLSATQEINAAVDKAYHAIDEECWNMDKAWEAFVEPVLEKHSKGGALDTEPRNLTYAYLKAWIKKGERPTWRYFT